MVLKETMVYYVKNKSSVFCTFYTFSHKKEPTYFCP